MGNGVLLSQGSYLAPEAALLRLVSEKPGAGWGSPLRVTPLYRTILRLTVAAMSPPPLGRRVTDSDGAVLLAHFVAGMVAVPRTYWPKTMGPDLGSAEFITTDEFFGMLWFFGIRRLAAGGAGSKRLGRRGWGEAAAAVLRQAGGRHRQRGLFGFRMNGALLSAFSPSGKLDLLGDDLKSMLVGLGRRVREQPLAREFGVRDLDVHPHGGELREMQDMFKVLGADGNGTIDFSCAWLFAGTNRVYCCWRWWTLRCS